MSNSTLTVAAVAVETVNENSADEALAAATVEASITLNFAVPAVTPVTSQRIPLTTSQVPQATGVVDPAIAASAALEATM